MSGRRRENARSPSGGTATGKAGRPKAAGRQTKIVTEGKMGEKRVTFRIEGEKSREEKRDGERDGKIEGMAVRLRTSCHIRPDHLLLETGYAASTSRNEPGRVPCIDYVRLSIFLSVGKCEIVSL